MNKKLIRKPTKSVTERSINCRFDGAGGEKNAVAKVGSPVDSMCERLEIDIDSN